MDWENRFSSIVRDTEVNLAKIRSRLGPSRPSSIMSSYFSSLDTEFGNSIESPSRNATSSFLDFPIINNEYSELPNLLGENIIKDSISITRLQLVEEKVNDQAKLIKDLILTVKQLENVKIEQQQENTANREELNALKKRLTEIELHHESENKLDLWRHDLKIGLSSIQNQLYKSYSQGDWLPSVQIEAFIKELYEMRHLLVEECDKIKRDFDKQRNKQMRVEADLDTLSNAFKEVSQQTDFLEKQFEKLSHEIESQKFKNEKSETERREIKNQLQVFRSHLQNFRDKLTSIDLADLQNPLKTEDLVSLKSISIKSSERKGKTPESIPDDDSFDLSSDFNISDDEDSKLAELLSDGHAADIDSSESALISSDSDTELDHL